MTGEDYKTAHPPLGWGMTTVGSVIDELNESNNIGKEKEDGCLIEYQGEIWKLERIKK